MEWQNVPGTDPFDDVGAEGVVVISVVVGSKDGKWDVNKNISPPQGVG